MPSGVPGCSRAKPRPPPPPTPDVPRRSYKIDCGVDSTLMLIIGCCVLGATVRGPHSPAHAAVLKPASARAPHVTAWRGGLRTAWRVSSQVLIIVFFVCKAKNGDSDG